MNSKILPAAIVALTSFGLHSTASADTLGFRVGGYSWTQEYSGDIQTDGLFDTSIDLNDDLGFDDDSGTVLYVALEHPVPLLPNILIQQTEMEIQESTTLSREIVFDGTTYSVSEAIDSDSDLSHTDATLYYEILDNWVNLDIGLTIRQFDGGISLESATEFEEEELEEVIPMLYLAARFDLPLTGLYVGASANGISAGDATITDVVVNIGYESSFGLGIEAGLRDFAIDYDDDGDEGDVSVDGAYIGAFYHF